jgi:hypothetical protein
MSRHLLDEARRDDVNTNAELFAQREHVFGRKCGSFQPLNRQSSLVSTLRNLSTGSSYS